MNQNFKKFTLSFSVILAFVGYALYQKGWFGSDEAARVIAPTSLNKNNISISSGIGGQYKDGAYTGKVGDAYYGNLQIKAVIKNGKISDVLFLQYPNDRSTSRQINTKAMPYLKAEAIQIQDSQVDIISGATQTTDGFRESLKSALDQTKI